jgi:hypothetical protein
LVGTLGEGVHHARLMEHRRGSGAGQSASGNAKEIAARRNLLDFHVVDSCYCFT